MIADMIDEAIRIGEDGDLEAARAKLIEARDKAKDMGSMESQLQAQQPVDLKKAHAAPDPNKPVKVYDFAVNGTVQTTLGEDDVRTAVWGALIEGLSIAPLESKEGPMHDLQLEEPTITERPPTPATADAS
jgi:hypothetical protein